MSDDYLWDRSGDPDPEIENLEKLLAGYGSSRLSLADARGSEMNRALLWVAAAASVAAIFFTVHAFLVRKAPVSAWQVTMGTRQPRPLTVGQTLDTGTTGAKLEAAFVGELRLAPHSTLRVVHSTEDRQHLALDRGTLHALIWAPPRQFVVDTPSAATVDLGCEYTLRVLPDGSGLLRVERGWVAFQAGAIESFIPAGAACHTRPQNGPGIPYFEDASAPLREAVEHFDTSNGAEGLSAVLANARPRDALTLWHLLIRTNGEQRRRVAEKFAQLVPGISAAGLAKRDPKIMDAAWNALGLGETDWWRTWKRKW